VIAVYLLWKDVTSVTDSSRQKCTRLQAVIHSYSNAERCSRLRTFAACSVSVTTTKNDKNYFLHRDISSSLQAVFLNTKILG
jgi:hypothetical protein